MATAWVTSIDWPRLRAGEAGRAPLARPGGAESCLAALDWATLDRVLAQDDVDVATVAAGRLVAAAPPRSAADVRRLWQRGVSTVVRASERHDPALQALATAFAQVIAGEVHVQLYATPAGTHSYGWHYDFEDVFIAQTRGVKDYYFRDNTVARDTRLGDRLDFGCIRAETSPLLTARLIAADWLYLPRRWWHLVRCVEDALSISVGVLSPDEIERAHRLPRGWSGQPSGAPPASRPRP